VSDAPVSDDLTPLFDLQRRDPALQRGLAPLDSPEGRAAIAGLAPAAASLLLPSLLPFAPGGKIILIVPGERESEPFRSDLEFAASVGGAARVRLFPSLEADPYQEMTPHLQVSCDRVEALRALREPGAAIVVVPVHALIYPLAMPATFDVLTFDVRAGQAMRPDDLSGALLAAGYERADLVESAGEFSRRGGIIDVWPPDTALPLRVEFWGEEIESLRRFDPGTQRSGETLGFARIGPVREYPWDQAARQRLRHALEERRTERRGHAAVLRGDDLAEKIESLASGRDFPGFEACVRLVEKDTATLFDYAPTALLALWEPSKVLSELEAVYVEMHASLDLIEAFDMPLPEDLLADRTGLQGWIGRARLRLMELALEEEKPVPARVACAPATAYHGRIQDFSKDLAQRQAGTDTVCLVESAGRSERLAEVLEQYGRPPRVTIAMGRLSHGFVLKDAALQVLTEEDVFGAHVEPTHRRRKVSAFSPGFRDLKVGDLVVHVEHGVGRYGGIARVGEGPSQRDFMLLFYEGNDKLYVPVDRLDLVQRYSGVAHHKPKLDRLGGVTWERTKRKVKRAMQDMAEELLALYAARAAAEGHAFPSDTPWQKEFEDAFPFPLTPDQDRAVRDAKADMERGMPMDRLICGDVGFGKTEVAMRAAFKAVMDGRQVAVLCPTTVLAFQHLNTFRERFASWPTTLDMISRFRTPKEQGAIVAGVKKGTIDLLIGTHRLLSKDIAFKRLGLLIVDEEQRFGVKHKEAIKAIKKDVDVLTLTATPIPRTLQMSLGGLRDMSVIETPPENRLAIQTAVVPFKEGTIAAAIRHELQRSGQVYFVHNRVESIGSMKHFLEKLVPEARIVVGHGQMSEGMLEKAMLAFLNGEFDILLATTIIENGLDIPRVNTLVVNRADRFGLAQLYQLRGRVGRSDRRAYAYLMVPAKKALSDVARRRLKALQEFTELGSGFRIAAMDLEIRGAGNLLGGQQSGHIAAVGFEMYVQMLERAVRELKGEAPQPETKAQINLGVDIRLPEEFVADFGERLVLYKEIASASDSQTLDRQRDKMIDLYGELPPQAERLFALARLRLEADALQAKSIDLVRDGVQIRLSETSPVSPEALVRAVNKRRDVRLTPPGTLRLDIPAEASDLERITGVRALLMELGARDRLAASPA
jgi:transcription-repair coupling factor (superfamily II helicase)